MKVKFWFLEVHTKLNVNFEIQGKSFLNLISCEADPVENLFFLIEKYDEKLHSKDKYKFDTTSKNKFGDSFASILDKYI